MAAIDEMRHEYVRQLERWGVAHDDEHMSDLNWLFWPLFVSQR